MAVERDLVGLIAGGGKFPVYFARGARKQKVRVYAFGLKGLTMPGIEEEVEKVFWLELKDLANIAKLLRENEVKQVAMAGRVPHSVLLDEDQFDEKTKMLLSMLPSRTPMEILALIVEELRRQDVTVIDSIEYLKEHMPGKGLLTPGRELSKREEKDVEFGMPVARALSSWDVGQTVVVKNGIVLAVEAIEGTNEAIRRGSLLGGEGTVVIKVSRPKKELRFDVPVLGLQTIKTMGEVKASAIAISAEETLFFDREKAVDLAHKLGIAIVAV